MSDTFSDKPREWTPRYAGGPSFDPSPSMGPLPPEYRNAYWVLEGEQMVHDPNGHRNPVHSVEPEPQHSRPRPQSFLQSRWIQWSLGLGIVGAGTAVAGGLWLSNYVRNDLTPLVSQQLSNILQRPVEVGPVSRFGLSYLRFSESTVPATATDSDTLEVPALTVRFNPFQALQSRTLRLHITAHDPLLYVEQAADGTWTNTTVKLSDNEGPFTIEVASLRLDNATAIALPLSPEGLRGSPVELTALNGQVTLNTAAEQIRVSLDGNLEPGATLKIQGQTDFQLQALEAQIQGTTLPLPLLQGLIANPFELPLSLTTGTANTDLRLTLGNGQLTDLQGTLDVENLGAEALDLTVPIREGSGRVVLDQERVTVERFTAQAGNVGAAVSGFLNWQAQTLELETKVAAVDLPTTLQTFAPEVAATLPVDLAGDVAATLALRGTFEDPSLSGTLGTVDVLQITGRDSVAVAGALDLVVNVGGTLSDPQLDGTLQATEDLTLDRLSLSQLQTRFRLDHLLALAADGGPPPQLVLQETRLVPGDGGLIRGGGTITLGTDSRLNLDFSGEDLPLEALAQTYGATLPVALGTLAVQTQVRGSLSQPQALLQFQALEAEYPLQGRVQWQGGDGIALDNAVMSVAGGTLRAQGRQTPEGWTLQVNASQLQPGLLDVPVAGSVDGVVNVVGPVNTFDPTVLRAQGVMTLSEGPTLLPSPLTTAFAWTGEAIEVRRAAAAGLEAQGLIQVALPGPEQKAGITGLDLAVQLTDYDLASLAATGLLPSPVALQGRTTFAGRIQGTPTAPQLQGDLTLANLAVNQATFDPRLVGRITQNPQGLGLQLAGDSETIEVQLDSQYQPQYAFFRRGTGQIQADRRNQTLNVEIQQFPLKGGGVDLPPNVSNLARQLLSSWVSGQVQVNLDTFNTVGSLQLDDPRRYGQNLGNEPLATTLQTLFGAKTEFRFANNVLSVADGVFDLGESRFRFAGRGALSADPQFTLDVNLEYGQIRDFLRALQWFDLVDVAQGFQAPHYAQAEALTPIEVGGNGERPPLGQQLQRFSEIKAQVEQTVQRRREQEKIPSLRDLAGALTGNLSLSGSRDRGVEAQFNFDGEDWTWGKYNFQTIALQGEFEEGQVTLQPVLLESEEMELRFAGSIGGQRQSGQFSIRQLPVAFVRQFVDLPLDIEGEFDLQASVGGSVANPQILGDLNLVNGSLNAVPLATRETAFSYLDGRLLFGSILEVDDNADTPVTIEGEIPYGLPFASVQPESNEIAISVNVRDQGLALLNLVSQNNLTWLGGEGDVNLSVGGTVQEPIAEGLVTLNGANVTAKALPEGEEITDLRGQIRFIRDRLQVEDLVGQFSEGQVTAAGILPLATPFANDDPDRASPLAVNFQNLNLNLPGLYNGGAGGDVLVVGSALNPRLTGAVNLEDGNILIPDPATVALQRVRRLVQGDNAPPPNAFAISPITFDNLQLQLLENVNVVSQPLFNFRAEGDLIINGGLGDLRPDGIISVTRGQVNLFTTNFTLARRRENVAVFRPENGLDPNLDVQLQASVTEVSNQLPTAGPIAQSEILDTPTSGFNELQTIRIQANVDGPASSLLQNLSLTSRPARSQSELYSLVGGGFVNTLGQGGDSSLALANLAGSALINNLQSAINNALSGPVDLRLFPTIVDSNKTREQADNDTAPEEVSNTLALGAEVGVNLTNSVSFSVLRLLTLDLPTRFNLRYQFDDNWQLRGASDLQGDNRFVVEYEARF